jgi:hypothetical protein
MVTWVQNPLNHLVVVESSSKFDALKSHATAWFMPEAPEFLIPEGFQLVAGG